MDKHALPPSFTQVSHTNCSFKIVNYTILFQGGNETTVAAELEISYVEAKHFVTTFTLEFLSDEGEHKHELRLTDSECVICFTYKFPFYMCVLMNSPVIKEGLKIHK